MPGILESMRGGLVVSCQALPDEPLHGAAHMAAMARAAESAGAVAIRANGPGDIAAIRAAVRLPVIGLIKETVRHGDGAEGPVHITPGIRHVREVVEAGAPVVALDATRRRGDLRECFALAHDLGVLVMADVSVQAEGEAAAALGADCVSTTLSGYTPYSPRMEEPDLELVASLVAALDIPVFAEGRYHNPGLARDALDAGAHAVVVGGAITRPQWIAGRFVDALG